MKLEGEKEDIVSDISNGRFEWSWKSNSNRFIYEK